MTMKELVAQIGATPDCFVYPSEGLPKIKAEYELPDDLQEFYRLCGGVTFYDQSDYPVDIVGPRGFVLANPIILTDVFEEPDSIDLANIEHVSWAWYLVSKNHGGEYITVDLAPARLGRCYYSFWDSHAMRGGSPIIANSFMELLERLLAAKGQEGGYWEAPGFVSLGDAYDEFDTMIN